MQAIRTNGFVFPGKARATLSAKALSDRLSAATPLHGSWFPIELPAIGRPSARTTPARLLKWRLHMSSAAKVENAYRRTDMFDRRRRLMADSAHYCNGEGNQRGGDPNRAQYSGMSRNSGRVRCPHASRDLPSQPWRLAIGCSAQCKCFTTRRTLLPAITTNPVPISARSRPTANWWRRPSNCPGTVNSTDFDTALDRPIGAARRVRDGAPTKAGVIAALHTRPGRKAICPAPARPEHINMARRWPRMIAEAVRGSIQA